jgi:hypothetical protein
MLAGTRYLQRMSPPRDVGPCRCPHLPMSSYTHACAPMRAFARRVAYQAHPLLQRDLALQRQQWADMLKDRPALQVPVGHPFRPTSSGLAPAQQDAMATIMAWLYSRIPYTR